MGHRSGFPNRGGAVRPNSGVMLAGATVRLLVILVAHSLVLLPCWAVGTQAVRTQPVPGEPQAPPGVEPPANLPDQGLEYIEMNGYPEGGEGEDGDSASYTSIVDTGEGGTRVDPRGSWLSFVQHSSRLSEGSNKKCEKKKKKKKERGELGNPRKLSEVVPTGLVGPQGPPGPPGPPGAQVSKEELLEEFRDLIKEAAERRAQIIIQEKCPTCSVENTTQMWLPTVHDDILMPHLPIAFHCKLRGGVDVPKKSLIEIANFQTPFSDGSFRRGDGMDVRSGRFTAPRSAIYQFSANLHIHHPVSSKRVEELRHRDNVRLLICINSLCQRHTSLEYISGLESNSRVFTVNLSGLLQLEAGQYASIYVDNSSVRRITVQAGSDFTGLLMGV
ncbi:adipolin-like [Acanthaster planci]|uniref:Adipolin n=1 Tax=Acanthaster planci TaxID=133434 RepID=A0A8B7XZ62_ACAPL|nr:adipolin-like [Acanthaster planci]